METELEKRRFGAVVRMEIDKQMSTEVRDFLVDKLEVPTADLCALPTPLDMRLGNAFRDLAIPELCYPAYTPATPMALQGNDPTISNDIFSVMRTQDILVHHPYDSFATTVQAFITQAARDPHVLAMKQTLYRTSGDSPIVSALIEAARAGKQVVAIVEIKMASLLELRSKPNVSSAVKKRGLELKSMLLSMRKSLTPCTVHPKRVFA